MLRNSKARPLGLRDALSDMETRARTDCQSAKSEGEIKMNQILKELKEISL